MSDPGLRDFLSVSKAIADESRVRILALLERQPLCVCQITEVLGLAPSTISKHLAILKNARLIEARKEGRWIYCRIAKPVRGHPAADARKWAESCLGRSPRLAGDRRRLQAISRMPLKALFKRLRKRRAL